MNEHRLKHLEMLQAAINRLAGNSFALKSWSVALVSALLALSLKDANEGCAILALFPALCFWGLDAYYLRQERLFRALYDAVSRDMRRPEDEQAIPLYSLDASCLSGTVDRWSKVLWSPTIIWLHGPIVVAAVLVAAHAVMR